MNRCAGYFRDISEYKGIPSSICYSGPVGAAAVLEMAAVVPARCMVYAKYPKVSVSRLPMVRAVMRLLWSCYAGILSRSSNS